MPAKKAPTKASTTTATKAAPKKAKEVNPLFESRPKNFGIGHVQPKRDLTRFLRWPKYIRLQRQRKILMSRLKVPPTINQFTRTLDKNSAGTLFKLVYKYKIESKIQKKQRLMKAAEAKAKGETVPQPSTKSAHLHYGINEVTKLVERKEAKLVVIAHDVDPIEIVVWLPTLCKKLGVPYVVVKGKGRLGAAVHLPSISVLCLTSVEKEDIKELTALTDLAMASFNNNTDLRRVWGGQKLGSKALAFKKKKEKAIAKELKAKQAGAK